MQMWKIQHQCRDRTKLTVCSLWEAGIVCEWAKRVLFKWTVRIWWTWWEFSPEAPPEVKSNQPRCEEALSTFSLHDKNKIETFVQWKCNRQQHRVSSCTLRPQWMHLLFPKTLCMWFCEIVTCTVWICLTLYTAVSVFSVWILKIREYGLALLHWEKCHVVTSVLLKENWLDPSLTCFLRASNAALMVWTRVLSRALASSLLVCWMALSSGRRPGPSSLMPTRFLGDSWQQ